MKNLVHYHLQKTINNSRKDEWICTICGVKGKSHEDREFNPPSAFHDWIGCDNGTLGDGEECNVYVHCKCIGMFIPTPIKSMHWLCDLHRPKSSKKKSVVRKR